GSIHPFRMQKSVNHGKPQNYEVVDSLPSSAPNLSDYAGSYYSDEVDATYIFVVRDGKLWLSRDQADGIPFDPTFVDNFWNDKFGYIEFIRDREKKITELSLTAGWIRRLRFIKRHI